MRKSRRAIEQAELRGGGKRLVGARRAWNQRLAAAKQLRGGEIDYDKWLEAMKTGIAIVDKRLEMEERREEAGKLNEKERKALETMRDLAYRVREENGWEEVDNASDAAFFEDWWTLEKTLTALGWKDLGADGMGLESNELAWERGWDSVDRAEDMLRYY